MPVVLLGRKQKQVEVKHAVVITAHQGEHKPVALHIEPFWALEEKVLLYSNSDRSRYSVDAVPGAGCAYRLHTDQEFRNASTAGTTKLQHYFIFPGIRRKQSQPQQWHQPHSEPGEARESRATRYFSSEPALLDPRPGGSTGFSALLHPSRAAPS